MEGKGNFSKRTDLFNRFPVSDDNNIPLFLAKEGTILMGNFMAYFQLEKGRSESLSYICSFSIAFSSK